MLLNWAASFEVTNKDQTFRAAEEPDPEDSGRGERGNGDYERDRRAGIAIEFTPSQIDHVTRDATGAGNMPVLLAGDPGCLPERIVTVREALLACLEGLEDCNARKRRHWRQTEANRRDGRLDDEPDREMIALRRETESWGEKIGWLQELGLRLERERVRCDENVAPDLTARALRSG